MSRDACRVRPKIWQLSMKMHFIPNRAPSHCPPKAHSFSVSLAEKHMTVRMTSQRDRTWANPPWLSLSDANPCFSSWESLYDMPVLRFNLVAAGHQIPPKRKAPRE